MNRKKPKSGEGLEGTAGLRYNQRKENIIIFIRIKRNYKYFKYGIYNNFKFFYSFCG